MKIIFQFLVLLVVGSCNAMAADGPTWPWPESADGTTCYSIHFDVVAPYTQRTPVNRPTFLPQNNGNGTMTIKEGAPWLVTRTYQGVRAYLYGYNKATNHWSALPIEQWSGTSYPDGAQQFLTAMVPYNTRVLSIGTGPGQLNVDTCLPNGDDPEDECPAMGTAAGVLEVPGKYPEGPYCKGTCEVIKDSTILGSIDAWDPVNNKTAILNTVYTGAECELTNTSSDPYPPADCTEAQNRCTEFCGINNIQKNTCVVGSGGEILLDCVCKDYPDIDPGERSPEPAVDPTVPETVPDPTDPTPDTEAADPEATPDTDTDKWLKAMKHAIEENDEKAIARLEAIKDSIGVTNDTINEGNKLGKNIADNTAATADNTSKIVNRIGEITDGVAKVEDKLGDANEKLGEIAEALGDETTGQSELASINDNQYDGTVGISDMPVEGDLQAILTTFYNFNPFRTVYENSAMNMNSANACLNFPNPLGGVSQQVCFDDFESTWNMMGLILVGLSGFMAFRIIKG